VKAGYKPKKGTFKLFKWNLNNAGRVALATSPSFSSNWKAQNEERQRRVQAFQVIEKRQRQVI
jgi:hypothetical protein